MRIQAVRLTPADLRRDQQGAGILDVVVTMVIFFAAIAIALPDQGGLRDSLNRGIAVKQFQADIRRARSEAVSAGARSVIEISPDGTTYEVGLDYLPYSNPPASDVRSYRVILPLGITLTSTATITFDPRGYSIDGTTGDSAQVNALLQEDGSTYATGTIFAAGFIDF